MTLIFDLGGHHDCQSYFVRVPRANFGDTTTIHFRFMSHWANTAQTDHVTLLPCPLTLEVMAVVVLHLYTKFEVHMPCHSEDMVHDVSALMGLVTLTFDP